MVAWDAGATLAERFRRHAGTEDHLYAVAMRAMADDWESGGPVREVCAGHEHDPPGSALQLRLLAGVFRLVLRGEAPELEPYYRSLGGERAPADVWPVLRAVVAAHIEELRTALEVAPQTNEVGRSVALLVGLVDLAARAGVGRVRLLELGASAGLNLLLDRFGYAGPGWRWGDASSPLQLVDAVDGPFRPQGLEIVGRAGCDLSPVDPTTPAGRELLTSFVWPFDLHRHARLAAALEVAREHPVRVDPASAAEWLPARLAEHADDVEVLTVVWHSITQLYWPAAEVEAVEHALADHGARHRLGRVGLEYDGDDVTGGHHGKPSLRSWLWDPTAGPEPDVRWLGTAHDHGVPVRLAPARPAGEEQLREPGGS